jgi:hypothetical protein
MGSGSEYDNLTGPDGRTLPKKLTVGIGDTVYPLTYDLSHEKAAIHS